MKFTRDELDTVIAAMTKRIKDISANGRYSAQSLVEAKREREKLDKIKSTLPGEDVQEYALLEAIAFHMYGESAVRDPVRTLERHGHGAT